MRFDMPCRQSKRLYLRPLEIEDACDVYAYCKDARTTRYLSFAPHTSIEETIRILQYEMLPYEKLQDFEICAIVELAHEKMIGHVYLHSWAGEHAQVGYVLHPAFWRQGYASEALLLMVDIAFTHCGLHRVEAVYEATHLASERVLVKAGFTKEGILREYTKLCDQQYHDMAIAARIKRKEESGR